MTAGVRYPWDPPPAPGVTAPEPDFAAPPRAKPRGRRPTAATRSRVPGAPAAPDWRYHHLTISGPGEMVEAFAAAARGSGVIPWQLDFSQLEEDVFVRAVAQPARDKKLTVAGCRILARQFRDKVEAHQARAAARVGHSRACPFDLHVLLPVPDTVLSLGPTDPTALAWLASHWDVTDRLRQVVVRDQPTIGRRRPRGHAVLGYGFFTHGETPQAAIDAIAPVWPALRFWLVPRPAD